MVKIEKLLSLFLAFVIISGTLGGCAGGDTSSTAEEKKGSSLTSEEGDKKPSGTGVLVLYDGIAADWTEAVVKEFQEETGIKVERVGGTASELMARAKAEADNPMGDVIWGGTTDSYEAFKDYLEPYECEAKNAVMPEFVVDDNSYNNLMFDVYAIAYNTDLISPEEAPTGWKDLLDPKWKGQIALADPSKSGSTYSILLTMQEKLGGDYSNVEQLIDNLDGRIINSSAAAIKALADGEYAITTTFDEPIMKFKASGAPIEIVYPEEGTAINASGVGILKGGPNLESAQIFIEYVMSQKVQQRLDSFYRRPTRIDLEPSVNMIPTEEISFTLFDVEAANSGKADWQERFQNYLTK